MPISRSAPLPSTTNPESSRLLREFIRRFLVHQRRYAQSQGQVPQARGLMMLKNFGPLTQGEFARTLGLEKSWVSRMVDRYVEEGWVERRHLETDRRCVQLVLTSAGQEQAAALDVCLDTHAGQLFQQIPQSAHAQIREALCALLAALNTDRPAGGADEPEES